jgi:hypothetical protein
MAIAAISVTIATTSNNSIIEKPRSFFIGVTLSASEFTSLNT